MNNQKDITLLEGIRSAAIPFGEHRGYDELMDLIGNASFVLLGEATHGTHEFYNIRAEITMRLIREKNFAAVAVEADWPDAYRVNRYIRGMNLDRYAVDSLSDFKRFPTWMWRNTEVLDFIGELREHNTLLPDEGKVGFYGLDLYSLYSSIEEVLSYLDRTDPEAAKRARYRYSCFEQFNHDEESYGLEAALNVDKSCEDEVVAQLRELQQNNMSRLRREGLTARGELFYAGQNARLIKNAEEYYRSMFAGRVSTWNIRDRHMAETVNALAEHFSQTRPGKIVVWEHNSHIGDARATDFSSWGEVNVGQIIREQHGSEAVLIGFTTSHGTVSAASDWGETVERKQVRPAIPGSYEDLFHNAGIYSFLLPLRDLPGNLKALNDKRLERAIGVVYLPQSERTSHYFQASLPRQFDAVIHIDRTTALEPLEYTPVWEEGEVPETFPAGL